MLSITYSAAASGVDGYEIRVECAAKKGLPSFEIVGLPDAAVRESEKRIFTSSESCGINIQSAEISINLAPADKKKEGTAMELASRSIRLSESSTEHRTARSSARYRSRVRSDTSAEFSA